ncbi:MAG: DUF2188 domain-containing protein [Pseudomonadota bacterium]
MARKGQHVVPNGKRWSVRKSGAEKASVTFDTQEQAIERGREIAKNQKTELYIHGRDGLIRERNSYGNDPHPPQG